MTVPNVVGYLKAHDDLGGQQLLRLLVTLLLCGEEEFPGSTAVLQRLSFMPSVVLRVPLTTSNRKDRIFEEPS
ncbi:hypothetical protein TNCV_1715951 [Trichonephila clavipes]|nr:hypothetical protein TNCV_1715951 [Trichonephila clavipes]